MIGDYLMGGLALVAAGAYACRVDDLSWWRTPWLMLLHALGGIAAAWVVYSAAVGDAGVRHALALCASGVLLWATWHLLPEQRRHAHRRDFGSDLMVSAPLIHHRDDRD